MLRYGVFALTIILKTLRGAGIGFSYFYISSNELHCFCLFYASFFSRLIRIPFDLVYSSRRS